MSTIVITTNPHDHGYEIVLGRDIAGPTIGFIGWDTENPCLVLQLNDEEHLPDTLDEVVAILAAAGYELERTSLIELLELIVEHRPAEISLPQKRVLARLALVDAEFVADDQRDLPEFASTAPNTILAFSPDADDSDLGYLIEPDGRVVGDPAGHCQPFYLPGF